MTLSARLSVGISLMGILMAVQPCAGQQAGATGPPLVIKTTSLPKGYVRQAYHARLEAQGGITPYRWELTDGSLPTGINLQADGELDGAPTQSGEFSFTVTVTDSGKPVFQKQEKLTLLVVAPLLAQWGKYPVVNGQRIEGSILVANQTEQDFDLTAIMLAVAENGRATAIGYQRLLLKKGTDATEIPFGENLPFGVYDLNVDVVAEVAATNSIYRARLVPKEKLQVQEGP
jgi:hypothetical protein